MIEEHKFIGSSLAQDSFNFNYRYSEIICGGDGGKFFTYNVINYKEADKECPIFHYHYDFDIEAGFVDIGWVVLFGSNGWIYSFSNVGLDNYNVSESFDIATIPGGSYFYKWVPSTTTIQSTSMYISLLDFFPITLELHRLSLSPSFCKSFCLLQSLAYCAFMLPSICTER